MNLVDGIAYQFSDRGFHPSNRWNWYRILRGLHWIIFLPNCRHCHLDYRARNVYRLQFKAPPSCCVIALVSFESFADHFCAEWAQLPFVSPCVHFPISVYSAEWEILISGKRIFLYFNFFSRKVFVDSRNHRNPGELRKEIPQMGAYVCQAHSDLHCGCVCEIVMFFLWQESGGMFATSSRKALLHVGQRPCGLP